MKRMQRRPWLKPSITRLRAEIVNKFGSVKFQAACADLDGVPIERLVADYGSPLFVVSERRLRENIRRLLRAFRSRYPHVRHGWSYKTNYLGAVCATLHQEGSWAEVVSEFEYEKARALGVPGSRIIFNGPHKSERALQRAVKEDARIHVDHLDELYRLDEIAAALGKQVTVAIRLNFDTGYTEQWNRFGFNVESGEALDAARRIAASRAVRLNGLHCHIGTFILDPRAYGAAVRTMVAFMESAEKETDCAIESLDLGGGFASLNALQGTYLPPEQVVPSIEQYAETICSALMEATRGRVARGKPLPLLILESGRAVVDDAEWLISTVVGTKRLPDGRRAAILDAGVNTLFTAFWYNHEVRVAQPPEGAAEETVLYGPLCMNIDVMRASIKLPPLSCGARLIFGPVGAYNNTQWMQFIEYRPAIVLIDGKGAASIVRKAEQLETMLALECLPDHLRSPIPDGNSG